VIKNDVNQIATGKKTDDPVEVGDNSIALAIASLSQGWSSLQDKIDAGGTFGSAGTRPVDAASFEDFYGSFISQVGIDVQQSENMTQSQSVLVTQMSNQRESVSGVSLDEEMANLIKFQKSYSAAARVVTVLDSLFDKILDMGVTR
jgi:flagellar hook-associated protein 1 FlgK